MRLKIHQKIRQTLGAAAAAAALLGTGTAQAQVTTNLLSLTTFEQDAPARAHDRKLRSP